MSLFEVGRLAVKIAGRDAGKNCVVVDKIDETFVMIDGQTRRRKCNIKHLEPLPQIIKIKKAASHAEVKAELKKIGLEILDTKPKEKTEKPKKQKKEKLQAKKEEKNKIGEVKKKADKEVKKLEEEKEVKPSSFEKTIEKEVKKEEK
jgi:large subunit ribosomal protein L14e